MAENNQLVIDLGDIELTEKQLKSLHKAIHKAVAQKVKKVKPVSAKTKKVKLKFNESTAISDETIPEGKTASLEVAFHNVDPGLSNLTATHNGESKTINESDTIKFDNVKENDTIVIKGDSAGSKTVTISGVKAIPVQMNFAEGQHVNGIFLVIA